MTANPDPPLEAGFVDRYQVLQLHPRADASMIDAAYWHLARRYSEALIYDPSCKARLDELNEAYSIIGSPIRREAYDRDRALILGAGALPTPPVEPEYREPLPLSIMERQRLRPRLEPVPEPITGRWQLARIALLRWRSFLPAFGALFLSMASVASEAPLALTAACLALVLLSTIVPLAGRRRTDRRATDREPLAADPTQGPHDRERVRAALLKPLRSLGITATRDVDKRAS